ncbi:MAG: hypothetical protein ACJ8C4_04375 [Gemmataceae bacterium]
MTTDENQSFQQTGDEWETIVAVKEGLADVASGRIEAARAVMTRLAAKHKLSKPDLE